MISKNNKFRYSRNTNTYLPRLMYTFEFRRWVLKTKKDLNINAIENYKSLLKIFKNEEKLLNILSHISTNNINSIDLAHSEFDIDIATVLLWELHHVKNLKNLYKEIDDLRNNIIRIPSRFIADIKNYLLYHKNFGSVFDSKPEIEMVVRPKVSKRNFREFYSFEPHIELRIYQDTTKEEIKKMLTKITTLQESIKNRNNASIKKMEERIDNVSAGEYRYYVLKNKKSLNYEEINDILSEEGYEEVPWYESHKKKEKVSEKLNIIKQQKEKKVKPKN